MFGSDILDVAIGLIFVFVLVSILCSGIREGIEALLKTRASHLEDGIRELLHDREATGLARHFFEHPLIFGLYGGSYTSLRASPSGWWPRWWPMALTRGRNMPSYIPSRNFALALMDMAVRGLVVDQASSEPQAGTLTFADVRANIPRLANPHIQRILLTAIDSAQGDLQQAQKNIEAWFDSSMDRVSGRYKRSTSWILFGIGLGMAIGLNINSLAIADYLYREKAAREALVASAQAAAANRDFPAQTYQDAQATLASFGLPIGWDERPTQRPPRLPPIIGWMLTALAASMGAPFWFDLLNKVMVIRSTVKPREKSPEEKSED
jgi:hypothetical protein